MGIYSVVQEEGLPFAKEHQYTISYPENPVILSILVQTTSNSDGQESLMDKYEFYSKFTCCLSGFFIPKR